MILVTRQRNLAVLTASALKAMHHTPLILPMLHIRYFYHDIEDNNYNSLIFTSINAANACNHITWMRDKLTYAVGGKTANTLSSKNFSKVIHCDQESQNSQSLIKLIRAKESHGSKLLYISGTEIIGNIDFTLNTLGFDVKREIVYQAIAVDSLSEQAVDSIERLVRIVTFYSGRTASIFSNLATKYNINLSNKIAICMSQQISQNLNPKIWKDIIISNLSNESSLLQAIQNIKY